MLPVNLQKLTNNNSIFSLAENIYINTAIAELM